MILTLHLAAEPGGRDAVRTLDQGTLVIGRGAENDWVLTDQDRTISKHHCRIDRSDNGFLLTDMSTNGVFFGTEVQPVGRGHSRPLADGDVVVVGPFRITAKIAADADTMLPDAGMDVPLLPESAAQPYSGTVQTPGSPIQAPANAPWLESIPGGQFGPGLRAGPEGWTEPPDPMDLAATGLRAEASPLDVGEMAFSQGSEHSAATATVIRLPVAASVLPMDWNDADPLDGADLAVLPVDAAMAKASGPVGDVMLPLHEPQEAWLEPPAPSTTAQRSAEPQAARLISAFLAGAGLPGDALADADIEASFRQLGELLRISVDGTREILATRAIVKSELRADQTVIQAANNNPMKFAPDVQRCLAAMVGQPPAGFMPGPDAMRRSMDDIKRHELALVAALNSVLAEMTTQLEPEAIASHVRAEQGFGGVLPYMREARCWAVYMERFRALQDSGAENTAGSLLAPVASAYGKHLHRGG